MFQITHNTIFSKKIHKPLLIAHLSDLHGARHGTDNSQITQILQTYQPDLIVMTGDMVDERDRDFDHFYHLCRDLTNLAGVYYTPGNHEQTLKPSVLEELHRRLNGLGVTWLNNQSQLLSLHHNKLRIYGLVTPVAYYQNIFQKQYGTLHLEARHITDWLGLCDRLHFSLMLSHNPVYFDAYRQWGADLTLSGHTHGGIIRLPGLGGLLSPECKLFPRYDGGYFVQQDKHLIVSRGLGNNFAFRFHNPPELVLIHLQPEK